jgi:hypothetical protein
MFRVTIVIVAFLYVIAVPVMSAAADLDECKSTWGVSCSPMRISTCPAGDFEKVRNGCGGSGDYIWIRARDHEGNPIPGIPWTDYWLDACSGSQQLCLCPSAVVADSLTNMEGRTTISATPFSMGGCVLSGGLYMAIQGKILVQAPQCVSAVCKSIIIVSPDLNSNCGVDLSDFSIFKTSYDKNDGDSGYNPCCDFNDDGCCDLSDLAFFAQHYAHECF